MIIHCPRVPPVYPPLTSSGTRTPGWKALLELTELRVCSYRGKWALFCLTSIMPESVGTQKCDTSSADTVRISGESRLWCGSGGKCTGGWTKVLLLVENSMTHQVVTLLRTDWKHLSVESSDVRWKIFHRKFSRTENFPENFPFLKIIT
jgi:hypothetical protein